ncbi:hypothetical protein FBQ95_17045 [Chloroflexi bacterium CFX3]|nr:hypothetical protein [Chloroflexi bacterium CFX3]
MEQASLEVMKAALDARLTNLGGVIILAFIIGCVVIVVLMRPVWLKSANNQGLLVQNISLMQGSLQAVSERTATLNQSVQMMVEQGRTSVQEIAALRSDLNQHLVQINLRFDQLPKDMQQIIGAEMVRHFQNRPRWFWERFRSM